MEQKNLLVEQNFVKMKIILGKTRNGRRDSKGGFTVDVV